MKKKTTLWIAALGVALAACGNSGAVVATVNGAEITVAEVEELFAGGPGAVPAALFADNLLNTIVERIVIASASSEFGVAFTPEQIEARRGELEAQITSQSGGLSYDEFLEMNGFTHERIVRIAHQGLVAEAVETALVSAEGAITDDEVAARYDAQYLELTEACLSHILVPTEEEAIDARERIAAGETFAEVAMDVGTDGTAANGGELGCGSLGQYVPEFALAASRAQVGETTQPVRSQFGYHLILVTERTTRPFEEVAADIRTGLERERGGTLVQNWLLERVTAAEVTIDERYGTWVTEPFPDVLPPA